MEITKTKNLIFATHKLKRNETYKISESEKFKSITIYKKPVVCIGFSSKTFDNKHILLLDYDNTEIEIVENDIISLQNGFGLSTAYIFKTSTKSYHVVFLDKFRAKEIINLMSYTHIDENFKDSPLRNKYRSWVLRISAKRKKKRPKFLKSVKSGISIHVISSAHKKLLLKLYPKIKIEKYKNEDNLDTTFIQEYETS